MMRLLVCGGRNFNSQHVVCRVLDPYRDADLTIIHGDAQGADRRADVWARTWGVPVETYPAQWALHGRLAGPMRNQRMLEDGRPDLVIAFPGGAGTADMVRRAKLSGVKVIQVDKNGLEIRDQLP